MIDEPIKLELPIGQLLTASVCTYLEKYPALTAETIEDIFTRGLLTGLAIADMPDMQNAKQTIQDIFSMAALFNGEKVVIQ